MVRYFGVYTGDKESPFPTTLSLTSEPTPIVDEGDGQNSGRNASGADVPDLVQLQDDFFEQIHSYIDGLPSLLSSAPLMNGIANLRLVEDVSENVSSGDPIEKDDWKFYPIADDDLVRVHRELDKVKRHGAAFAGMDQMILLGAVSQFDAFMGRLLRLCLDKRPDIISKSEKNFAAHEVLQYSDISAFKHAVTEKTVETFLRSSHQDQFEWLEKHFDLPLRKDLPSWPAFIEAFERRNLFAHSQGIVSETYRLKCLEAGLEDVAEVGTQLEADVRYIASRLRVFAEIGLKLTQVLSRKLLKETDELKEGRLYI